MVARQLPRERARQRQAALATLSRRPGGAEALRPLASAVGNRNFCALIARQSKTAKKAAKVDYAKAERANRRYAQPPSHADPAALGWSGKLATVAPDLDALWKADDQQGFADAVVKLQEKQGSKGKALDGVLGPTTWSRLAGLGEGMASIPVVQNTDDLCYMATQRRIEGGTRRATGKAFKLPKGAKTKHFDTIIAVRAGKMMSVDKQYRGAGAAGALVYSGQGTFVPEADIWAGKLQAGAAIQVWADKSAYDLLQTGEVTEKGKTRPIKKGDANFLGTSYVFLRYDDTTNERVLVRHHSSVEWHDKSDWAVWIAANPGVPAAATTP
jgi:hypothetical protein